MKDVNNIGIAEIAEFLRAHHKNGARIADSAELLNGWAAEAEFQLAEGNPPCIEIRSRDSVHGYTVEFTIPECGIDTVEMAE